MAKPFAKKFYNSKRWKITRQYILRRDRFLCVMCGAPAEEVHHIERLSPSNVADPRVATGEDNLVSLCKDCHFKEHEKEKNNFNTDCASGYAFDANGELVKAPLKNKR